MSPKPTLVEQKQVKKTEVQNPMLQNQQQQQHQHQEQAMSIRRDIQANPINAEQKVQGKVERKETFEQDSVIHWFDKVDKIENQIKGQLLKDLFASGGDMDADRYIEEQSTKVLETLKRLDQKYNLKEFKDVIPDVVKDDKGFVEYVLKKSDRNKIKESKNIELHGEKSKEIQELLKKADEKCTALIDKAYQRENDLLKLGYGEHSPEEKQMYLDMQEDVKVDAATLSALWSSNYRDIYYGKEIKTAKNKTTRVGGIKQIEAFASNTLGKGERTFSPSEIKKRKDYQAAQTQEEKDQIERRYKHVFNIYSKMRKQGNAINGATKGMQNNSLLDESQKVIIKRDNGTTTEYTWDPKAVKERINKDISGENLISVVEKESEDRKALLDFENATAEELEKALEAPAEKAFDFANAPAQAVVAYANSLEEAMKREIWRFCVVKYDLPATEENYASFEKAMKHAFQNDEVKKITDITNLTLERIDSKYVHRLDVSEFTQSLAVKQMQMMHDYMDDFISKKTTVETVEKNKSRHEAVKVLFSGVDSTANEAVKMLNRLDSSASLSEIEKESVREIVSDLRSITGDKIVNLTTEGLQKIDACERQLSAFLETKAKEILAKEEIEVSDWKECLNGSIKDEKVMDALKKNEQWPVYETLYGVIKNLETGSHDYRTLMESMAGSDYKIQYLSDIEDVQKTLKLCGKKLENSTFNNKETTMAATILTYKEKLKALREAEDSVEDGKKTEAQKIAEGRVTYKLLNEYDNICASMYDMHREARNKELLDRPQERHLVDMVYSLKADYIDRILEEKKDVLACYEGSLILKNMPDKKSYKDNKNIAPAKKVVELANYYNDFQQDCEVYLDRYSNLDGNSFYVGKVKTQLEFVQHKIRKTMGATAEDLFDNLNEGTKKKLDLTISDQAYGVVAKDIYQKLMADNQDIKKLDFTDCTEENILQVVYDLAVTQRSMDKAGLKGADALNKALDYKGVSTNLIDKFEANGNLTLNSSLKASLQNVVDKEKARTWFLTMVKQFNEDVQETWKQYADQLKAKTGETPYMRYFVGQTQLGTRLEVLNAIGRGLGLSEDKEILSLYVEAKRFKNEAKVGGEQTSKMLQEAGWKTYLKLQQQTGVNKEKEAEEAAKKYEEKEAAIKASIESPEIKAAITGLQELIDNSETEEFKAVRCQLDRITEIEMGYLKDETTGKVTIDYEEKETDGYINFEKKKDLDYPRLVRERNAAYKELAVLVQNYITKKGWRRTLRSRRGKNRLNAMERLLATLKTYYGVEENSGNLDELRNRLENSGKNAEIKKKALDLGNEKSAVARMKQSLIDDKKIAEKNQSALDEFKRRYDKPEDGKKLTLEEFYRYKQGLFGKMLIQKDRDLFVNTEVGAKFYIDLKTMEKKLKDDKVVEMWKGAKKLKIECYGKDFTQMTEAERFDLWSKCQEFIKNYASEQNPAEAQKILEEIKTLSNNYVSQKEYERMLSEMEKDRLRIKSYAEDEKGAYRYTDSLGVTKERLADMLFLLHKYKMFLKGAEKLVAKEKLSKEEKEAKAQQFSDFKINLLRIEERVNTEIFKDDKNKVVKTGVMKEARRNLDARLERMRTLLDNNNFAEKDKTVDKNLRTALKEAAEEITFYLETFADLKTKNGKTKTIWMYLTGQEPEIDQEAADLMEYYSAQRDNLRKIMAQSAISELSHSDLHLNQESVDERLQAFKKNMANGLDKSKKISAENANSSNQIKMCLEYILEVELEYKQLGGIKKLRETQPEMAAELGRQMMFRAEYEPSLKGLNAEKKKLLHEALNNMASDYLKKLEEKMKDIDSALTIDGERMNYYYVGFSATYDKASEFLKLIGTWDSSYESKNYRKLKNLVQKVEKNTREVLALYHFKDEDATIRDNVNNLKDEAVKRLYATDRVVKQRDQDFANTMKNLSKIRLGSAQEFRVNKEIKNWGLKYNQEGYKDMKVRNDSYFKDPIFGHVWWGTETYSLDELIGKLYNESDIYNTYDAVEPLMVQLIELKRMASLITDKEFLADQTKQEEEAKKKAKEEAAKKAAEAKKKAEEKAAKKEAGENENQNQNQPEEQKEVKEEQKEEKKEKKVEKKIDYRKISAYDFRMYVENLDRSVRVTYTDLHDRQRKMGDQKIAKKVTKFSESFYKAWQKYYPSLKKLSDQMEGYLERNKEEEEIQRSRRKSAFRLMQLDTKDLSEERRERLYIQILKQIPKYEFAECEDEHRDNILFELQRQKYSQWFENYSFKKAQEVATKFRSLAYNSSNTEKYAYIADYHDFIAKIEEYYMNGAIDKKVYDSTKAVVEREVSKRGVEPVKKEQLAEIRAQLAALYQMDDLMNIVNQFNQLLQSYEIELKDTGNKEEVEAAIKKTQMSKDEFLKSIKDRVSAAYEYELLKYRADMSEENFEKLMKNYSAFAKKASKVFSDNRMIAQQSVKDEIAEKRKELEKNGMSGAQLEQELNKWISGDEVKTAILAMKFRWWNLNDISQKIGLGISSLFA